MTATGQVRFNCAYRCGCLFRVFVLCTLAVLASCGSQQDSAATQRAESFATAEDLIEYINQLLQQDPIDQDGLLSLYFIENDVQKRLYQIERDFRPFAEFRDRVFRRFGEGLSEQEQVSPLAPIVDPVVLVDFSDRRARAIAIDSAGLPLEIHIVKIDDSWHMSGYTLEFIAARQASDLDEAIQQMDLLICRAVPASRKLASRLEADEFSTIEEVRSAWREELAAR